MTSPFGLTPLTFEQAFLRLEPAVRMWIQLKSNQIAHSGQFGTCEVGVLEQQMKARFGPSAAAGDPSLVHLAIFAALQRLQGELASASGDAQPANLELQKKLQQQAMLIQLLTNVSKSYHDTAKSTIQNLRG